MKKKGAKKLKYGNLILGCTLIGILILVAIFADFVAPYNFDDASMTERLQAPGGTHLFGTDLYGRDVFSRVIYASRIALKVGLMSVSI